ncbi:MAG TPA: M56 family metallopeptidase [Candidatus Acidoferrales bacterium]|nr:M56 family metallopeptidase [Candidatus Acidoferrales bacterium]
MITDQFVRASTSLLAYLAEPAARAIALGCLAAIVLAALRVKRVPLRLMTWTLVLYGAVAIALVGWLLPGVTMRVPGAARVERVLAVNRTLGRAFASFKAYVSLTKAAQAGEIQNAAVVHETNAAGRALASASDPAPVASGQELRFVQDHRAQSRRREQAARARMAIAENSPAVIPGVSATGQPLPAAASSAPGTEIPPAPVSKSKVIPWAVVAAGIYAAIAFLLLSRLLLGLVLSHRLARLSEKITDADALRKLRFRAYASGLENVPRLAESELVSVPATLSVFRPLILLPAHWREWNAEKFDAILAHEVSHVARRDSLTQRISLIHRAIFWFSPLAWWLDRKLNELAEEASDEAALGAGVDKKHYAETLLGFFADLEAASGRVWWQGVSMASDGTRAGHAERRVERILAWGGSISMRKSLAVALVAVAAPIIFIAAAVHPVIARAQDKTQTQDDSKNVIMPGGPKAPAMPNAPKGGVVAPAPVAPALAAAPQGAVTVAPVVVPAMPAPPQGGVTGPIRTIPSAPSPSPELMPVPGAPAHPPIVPGPIANGPVAPSAMTAPAVAQEPSVGIAPVAPAALLSRTATHPPMASRPLTAMQAEDSSDLRAAEMQVRAAQQQVKQAEAAMPKNEDVIAAAQAALSDAEAQLTQVRSLVQSVQDAKEAAEAARKAMEDAQDQSNTIINGNFNSGSGPRYVMMSKNSNDVSMSGDEEDLQHARALRKKLNSDFIWFEKDEKSYVITDPNFIAQAKALFAPEEALEKQQDELGRQQDELGRQQDALGEKMDGVRVRIRDITPELEEVRARLKELSAQGGATQEELGRLQSQLGQLQSEVGHSQSEAGVGQSAIGRQQAELGRKQGELGRRQGELGRQEGAIARKASQELRQMFDDAITKGIAKPE